MMTRATFAGVLLVAAGSCFGQVELYAVDFPGNLYQVNQSTGAAMLVGFTGTDRLNSAAANSAGMIYASRSRNPGDPMDVNQLIRIDPATGMGTLVADYGQEQDLRGLAFAPGGVLYGIRDNNFDDDLVTIDPMTGAVMLVGPTGRSDVQGLTATGSGELFAVGVAGGGIGGGLYKIDAGTGLATVISPGMGAGGDVQTIEWAEGTKAWIGRANLRTVDLATGAAVMVGPFGVTDVRGLAAVEPAGCYADCDGNGALNIDDFICFQLRFALADPYADCDGNSVFNIDDFICFQLAFALGC